MAQDNSRGFDPTQTAEYWLEKKVYTVPLRSRSKRPKGDRWQHLRLVGAELHKKFKPGDNIGALWGEASDHATDVDLDLEEAPLVAAHLLPETFIYGRRKKPDSHYVYRCVGAETKKWQVKSLGTIVEIRSTGAQSVLPPSIHPDSDRYYIELDIAFHDVTKLELERLCDEIAIAAVFLYHYPEKGGRHDFIHACAGSLCHANWPEDKVRRVMAAVLSEVYDDDEEINDRLGSVVNTIERFNTGDHVKGLTSLEAWMAADVIMGLRRWMQSGTYEGRLLTEPVNIVPKKGVLDFNDEWLRVPGLVGDIIAWASGRAYLEQPMFSLATAITCTALASCNHYLVKHWKTPLQPYIMITGSTGSGKDSALSAVAEFSAKIQMDEFVVRGVQSYYAMLDRLAEPPNILCLTWDEAARNLASAKNINSPDFQTITHILSLYGSGNKIVPATPGRKNPIPELIHPFFTMLATAQPDMLMDALTSAAQETGVVNRIMLFDSGDYFPPINQDRKDNVFPSKISRPARALRDHTPVDDFTFIEFATTRVFTQFQEFEEMARRRTARKEYSWARANQNALILAGTAAVGIDPHRPVISPDLAKWAMQIVTWSNNNWEDRIRLTGGDTPMEKESFKIQKIICNPLNYQYLAKQKSQHKQLKLIKQGFMPRSALMRGVRGMPPRRFNEILDELHDSGLIGSTEKDGNACYFAKE